MNFADLLSKIKAYARSHPLVSFFALTYTISWLSWLLFWRLDTGYVNGFEIVAALGPSLAAMAISGILEPEKTRGLSKKRMRLFWPVLVLVMAVILLLRYWVMRGLVEVPGRPEIDSLYPTPLAILLDIIGAATMALVISGIYSPRKGVRGLLKTLDFRQAGIPWRWLLIAVAAYPVVIVAGNALTSALGLAVPELTVKGMWFWVALDAVFLSTYGLFFGGGFEEPGWRGFAMPALQKRFTPLASCLILGPLWALWHWPLFWGAGIGGSVIQVIAYSLATIQYSVLLAALYKWSGRSLPAVILFHSAINIAPLYIPITTLANIMWLVLSLILAVWMWRRPEKFAVETS